MKKIGKSFKLFIIMIGMILLTGCVKLNTNMNITESDVKITTIVALQDSLYEQMEEEQEQSEDPTEEYKNSGYTVENYKQDGYTGYKLTKSLGSLESLSHAKKDEKIDMTDLFSGKKITNKNLFSVENNVYSAHFVFNTDDLMNDVDSEEDTYDTDSDWSFDNDADTSSEDDLNDLFGSDFDADTMKNMFDLKFEVTLPTEVISHNATEVSSDKKTLTWDLTKTEDIQFRFKSSGVSSMLIIGIASGVGVVLLALIIFMIVKNKNKKKNIFPTASQPTPQPMNNMNQQPMPQNNVQPSINQQVVPNANGQNQNNINQ